MGEVMTHAKILWDYLRLGQECAPVDAIVALGSDSTRVAQRAADLWYEGYSNYVIVTGGQASRSIMGKTEAEIYANILRDRGVPSGRIIIESAATNTGENILFIKKLLEEQGYLFRSFLLVQKPYMERRVYATFCKLWPEATCIVTSPAVTFEEYTRDTKSRDLLVQYLVGTLYRVQTYPQRGFQIAQDIPEEVIAAFEFLCERGYTQSML